MTPDFNRTDEIIMQVFFSVFFFFGSHLHFHLGSIVRARTVAPERKRPKSREIFKSHLNDSFRYLPQSLNGILNFCARDFLLRIFLIMDFDIVS